MTTILTINNLSECFKVAKVNDAEFVGIKIQMDGFEKDEVIINEKENFDAKLAYYQKTYYDNLNHRFSAGIRISGFTYGYSFEDIQYDFYGGNETV